MRLFLRCKHKYLFNISQRICAVYLAAGVGSLFAALLVRTYLLFVLRATLMHKKSC